MKAFIALLMLLVLASPQVGAAPKIVAEPFPPAQFTVLAMERSEGTSDVLIRLAGNSLIYTAVIDGKKEESIVHPSRTIGLSSSRR